MKQYKLLNNVLAWCVFIISAITYILTLEPTASFWDCGEFISSALKLEVGHPPGNPIFMLTGRFFANFASDPSQVAYMVNLMSALLSAATILFLFWTITHLARVITVKKDEQMTTAQMITILGCGLVGSLAYAFSDTFWFSAVEGEVYAYSSFCTAIVFWLILKWEDVADEPHADRYIVLIAYLMGISIGVHLLNLLCIPAIVLVYYYKKYPNANLKGSLLALVLSFAIIVLLLYGLIPGFVKVTGWAELLCVNVLGLPFNSGVVIYFFLVVGAIIWGIYETMSQRSPIRIKISFILVLSMMGVPFFGNSVWIGLALIAALSAYLFMSKKVAVRTFNMILTCLMVIFVGYSSYALILIRSTANPPMDQNSPEDIFELGRYLNREQYGDRPLFYGQTFVSDVVYGNDGRVESVKGNAIWDKSLKTNPDEKDKYILTGYKEDYVFNPDLNTLFPRMYSKDARHVEAYKEWTNFEGKPVKTKTIDYKTGQYVPTVVNKPTFGENIKFFLDYQLNYMYWRYFMWNFAGRQNDLQGYGEVDKGNWITGFNFIDQFMVGDQDNLPPDMANNKGRNRFYLMPLLLGLIGLAYQAFAGKKGIEGFWVTFFLFFMTGIAIVIYLNQSPYQPRERDYAYAGSFYAFCIWIGLGVAALAKGLERFTPPAVGATIASLLALIVPIQMVSQTWDDHDRSGRYTARDFGMNYLSSIDENGIIFTNGDNDTFPLWYAQEVEGFRPDIRVCNLSYLVTDWYISQMKSPAYTSASLPISMTDQQYSLGKRDYARIYNLVDRPIALNMAMKWLLSDNNKTKEPRYLQEMIMQNKEKSPVTIMNYILSPSQQATQLEGYNDYSDYLPAQEFTLPIDSAALIASGRISPEMAGRMVKEMSLSFKDKNALYKNELAILDILNTNNETGWKRPVYFAATVGPDMYMNMTNYFSLTGLAYEVLPVDQGKGGGVNTEKMYDNMMNKFKWGGIENPDVYLDENIRRMCRTLRLMFVRLTDALIEEGKNDKALKALDYSLEKIPASAIAHDYTSMALAENYFKIGEKAKGSKLLNEIADNATASLKWYLSLSPNKFRTVGSDAGLSLNVLHNIVQIYNENGDKVQAEKYEKELDALYRKYVAAQERK